jgi:anti-sigma B factor antagonist
MDESISATNLPFEVVTSKRGRQDVTLSLSGELDLGSAPKLRECLAELAHSGVINMEIDLTNLTFLDSTGISLLVTAYKKSTDSGGSFIVCNAPPQSMRVLEITGLIDLLSVTALETSPHKQGTT